MATAPRPEPHVLDAIYNHSSYHERRSDASPSSWRKRAQAILATLPVEPKCVLDFGAGEGHLVAAFRDLHIEAEGIEESSTSRSIAEKTHGIELHRALGGSPPRRFDAAILLHSLEHLADPLGTVRQIRGLLAPGGVVFVEVPHAASIDLLLVPRQRQAILDLPVHLHHFTPRTLGLLMALAGISRTEMQLFNATSVEWILNRRRMRLANDADGAAFVDGIQPVPRAFSGDSPGHSLKRGTDALLQATRRVFAGPKFRWIGIASGSQQG